MKAPLQNEILDVLKLRLLPEIGEMRKDFDAFRIATQAEFRVVHGHLEQIDKRLDQMTDEMHELRAEMREVRSYVFTSQMNAGAYVARDRPKP